MALKLYGATLSPNVVRVLVCLEEVGAKYEHVPINFSTGEHKQPPHLARNPFGQVPALEDGDLVLFESRAISRYVLRKHSSDLLRRTNLAESAAIDVWLDAEANQFHPAVSPITFQCLIVPRFGGVTDENIVNASMEKLRKVLEVYEARLAKSKYLAGDFISLTDLSHFPLMFNFMRTAYASVIDDYSRVKAWWESILARPAIKRVIEIKEGSK